MIFTVLKVAGWAILFGSLVWSLKMIHKQRTAVGNQASDYIRLHARIPVGHNQTLLYFETDDLGFVVGVTEHGFDLLHVTEEPLSESRPKVADGKVVQLAAAKPPDPQTPATAKPEMKPKSFRALVDHVKRFLEHGGGDNE